MKSFKKDKLKRIAKDVALWLLIFVVVMSFLVGGIEYIGGRYQCQPIEFPEHPPCVTTTISANGDSLMYWAYPDDFIDGDLLWLASIREKRINGEFVSKSEYRAIMEWFIVEVSEEQMPKLNGLSCGNFGYVREDLPEQAKLFVRRHEFEHIMQEGMDIEGNQEFLANVAAAREYPTGLIQTMIFSLRESRPAGEDVWCYFFRLWKGFKMYFLPFESEPLYKN